MAADNMNARVVLPMPTVFDPREIMTIPEFSDSRTTEECIRAEQHLVPAGNSACRCCCLIRSTGLRKLSPGSIHPKADRRKKREFRSNFKALSKDVLPDGADLAGVDLFFQADARIGQKRMQTRVWPRANKYGWCCLFSAICLQSGSAVGHGCGRAYTDELNRHLRKISAMVADGRHALLVLDGIGWHRSKVHEIPGNAALLRLQVCSPELYPAETVFQ